MRTPAEMNRLAAQSQVSRPGQSREGLPPTTRVEWLLQLLITCVAGVLRTVQLMARGLNLDEGFSVFLAQTSGPNFVGWIWRSELNMALYYALLRVWVQFGNDEFAIGCLVFCWRPQPCRLCTSSGSVSSTAELD